MLVAFTYGMMTVQYKIFPFKQVVSIVKVISSKTSLKHSDYFYHKKSFFEQHGAHNYDAVLIGDSLTDDAEWQDLFPSLKLANRGIDGDRTNGILKRLEGIYSTSAPKAFIMIGINDFSWGKSVDEVFNNYKIIVHKLVDKKMDVYIQSTILAGKQKKGLNKKVTLLNEHLQVLAKQTESITYIDLNAGLATDSLLNAKFTRDGIHLNGDGYAVWKERLKPYILHPNS